MKELQVTEPLITFTSARVKEGKLADYERLNRAITELVEAKEPRIIAFHVMATEDRDSFVGMQFHPDAQSMEFHLETVRELIADASDILEIEEFKVLGRSSEVIDGLMKTMAESGIKVEHLPHHMGGFTRSSASK
jgi:quinol monooxygenase YgiN